MPEHTLTVPYVQSVLRSFMRALGDYQDHEAAHLAHLRRLTCGAEKVRAGAAAARRAEKLGDHLAARAADVLAVGELLGLTELWSIVYVAEMRHWGVVDQFDGWEDNFAVEVQQVEVRAWAALGERKPAAKLRRAARCLDRLGGLLSLVDSDAGAGEVPSWAEGLRDPQYRGSVMRRLSVVVGTLLAAARHHGLADKVKRLAELEACGIGEDVGVGDDVAHQIAVAAQMAEARERLVGLTPTTVAAPSPEPRGPAPAEKVTAANATSTVRMVEMKSEPSCPAGGHGGMRWRQAAERAAAIVRERGCPSVRELAVMVGCSASTMHKAMENTPALKEVKDRRPLHITMAVDPAAIAAAARAGAAGPAEVVATAEEYAIIMGVATPEERAVLNGTDEPAKLRIAPALRQRLQSRRRTVLAGE